MSDTAGLPAQAATTPQQQPQGTPIQQNAPTPASVAGGSGDQLVCQWQSCGERLPSAEQLYVSPTRDNLRAALTRKPITMYIAWRQPSGYVAISLIQYADPSLGSRLRAPCRSQEHQQSEFDLPVG
jgi:hypothetical protein